MREPTGWPSKERGVMYWGGGQASSDVAHKCCSLATRPPKGGTQMSFLTSGWWQACFSSAPFLPDKEEGYGREGCAVWLLTATGFFCLMRQPRCRPEFTIVTTENQSSLSITLTATNRNLLFKTDSILISLGSGLEGKREVYSKNFPLISKKNTTQHSAFTLSYQENAISQIRIL